MIAVNNYTTTVTKRQVTYSSTSISFSSMLSQRMGSVYSMGDFACAFGLGDNDIMDLYGQLSDSDFEDGLASSFFKDVDKTRIFNESSKGDMCLTVEQITILKQKYNVSNLTPQQQYDLLCDLTDLHVISADEARCFGKSTIIMQGVIMQTSEYRCISMHKIPQTDMLRWLDAIVYNEHFEYNHMIQLGINMRTEKNLDIYAYQSRVYTQFESRITQIDYMMTSHVKLAGIIGQLAEGSSESERTDKDTQASGADATVQETSVAESV